MHTTTGTAITWKNDGESVALSGTSAKIGAFIGVFATDIHPGETGAVNIAGVYRLPKTPGESWDPGTRLSYDVDTGLFSAGSGSGIGCVAAGYAAADEESGLVLLNAGAGADCGGDAPTLASWHVLDLAESYNTGGNADIEAYLRLVLPLSTMKYYGSDIIKLKPLDIAVGDYTWEGSAIPNTMQATADVTIIFPDGSTLQKRNIMFTRSERSNGRIYAARPEGNAYIDTGLTLDYSYEFEVEGYVNAGNGQQAVLMGASSGTSTRTTVRLLGGSNKMQICWPYIEEILQTVSNVDVTRMFKYKISKSLYAGGGINVEYSQDSSTVEAQQNAILTGTDAAGILLFNETPDADYSRGILREAIIRDSNGNTLRQFQPWYLDGEIVMVDVANNNQVYRPAKGVLIEVPE